MKFLPIWQIGVAWFSAAILISVSLATDEPTDARGSDFVPLPQTVPAPEDRMGSRVERMGFAWQQGKVVSR